MGSTVVKCSPHVCGITQVHLKYLNCTIKKIEIGVLNWTMNHRIHYSSLLTRVGEPHLYNTRYVVLQIHSIPFEINLVTKCLKKIQSFWGPSVFNSCQSFLRNCLWKKLKNVIFQQNNNIHYLIFIKDNLLESIKFNL